MSASPGFVAMIEEVLSPLGRVTVRRMFSGAGVFCDGAMFGLVMEDLLHLKTDAATRARFEAEDCVPFTYDAKGRTVTTSYWRVPEHLYDDTDELVIWSRIALELALKSGAKAKRSRKVR